MSSRLSRRHDCLSPRFCVRDVGTRGLATRRAKAIAIGLLAAASIALSTAANAQVWVGAGSTAWWGGYWHYDRGHLGPTANNYWRYYRIPCQVVRDGSGQWWVTRCM
jgi:hypothetical protein